MFFDVAETKEGTVNKHQSDRDRDLNPVAFLGESVNEELLLKSIEAPIVYKNCYEGMKLEFISLCNKLIKI